MDHWNANYINMSYSGAKKDIRKNTNNIKDLLNVLSTVKNLQALLFLGASRKNKVVKINLQIESAVYPMISVPTNKSQSVNLIRSIFLRNANQSFL